MKYPNSPEIIASIEAVNKDGDTFDYGDHIMSVSVRQDKGTSRDGTVDIDIRNWTKKENLIIRIPLPELFAALASATLNADRDIS